MDTALTFGSVGDIIQVCQIALQLGRAVGTGHGAASGESSKEYQALQADLNLFVQALTQVRHVSTITTCKIYKLRCFANPDLGHCDSTATRAFSVSPRP
jgi:hypothetical protein